ncbi:tyrosine-type recombinase/integrase [Planctomycetota bacterium]
MKISKRKTRSDKFPLTLHPTGQYCKKIKGKIRYFGTDKNKALEKYLAQATYLHGAQSLIPKISNGKMTLKQLCDLYLRYQNSRVLVGDITAKHYNDQTYSLNRFMVFLGQGCRIENISTLDLQNYKRKLQSSYPSVDRQNLHIGLMKAMFHWARKNDVLEGIPNIDAISKDRVVHKEKYTFNKKQIRKLLSTADVKMKAMIWLDLNCGFGCTDCSRLKWEDLDFKNSRVELARSKTKIDRNLPLWPETIKALKEIPRSGSLVFTTSKDHPWIRTTATTNDNGEPKYIIDNRISTKFSRLMKKVGIQAPKGTGFYTFRRTAATIAARSGDPFAVQRLLGHVDLTMATRYVQDVSEQTDRVIENSRKHFIGKEDVA